MAEKQKGTRRLNIYFRQTAKAFKAARQTAVFSHINRNLPYRMYQFSKERFLQGARVLNRFSQVNKFKAFKDKLPQKQK